MKIMADTINLSQIFDRKLLTIWPKTKSPLVKSQSKAATNTKAIDPPLIREGINSFLVEPGNFSPFLNKFKKFCKVCKAELRGKLKKFGRFNEKCSSYL